ncbi:MAG: ATP-grasp domain-containing protein [Pseudonocardiaceae bacterium]
MPHVLFMNAMYRHKMKSFQTAREMGCRISVVGPDLPDWAVPFTDRFIRADTADSYGLEQAVVALTAVHREEPFDGVVTFWDHGVLPAAKVAQALGLPGDAASAARVRNKAAMREALGEYGVPGPAFAKVSDWAQLRDGSARIGFPAIYKPTGAAGSAGVVRIDCAADLRSAFDNARRYVNPERDPFFAYYPHEFVLEEFVEGLEVSVEGVVAGGEVHIVGVTEKKVCPETFVEIRHVHPARIASEERNEVESIASAAVRALGLAECGFHAEIILTASGGQVVEVNGRLGGDFIASHLVPLATGIDLTRATIATAMGRPVDLSPVRSCGACIQFLVAARPGTVQRWTGLEAARRVRGVVEFGVNKQVGDSVLVPPEGFFDTRICFVITQGIDADDAVARAEKALSLVRCRIAGPTRRLARRPLVSSFSGLARSARSQDDS